MVIRLGIVFVEVILHYYFTLEKENLNKNALQNRQHYRHVTGMNMPLPHN